MESTVARQTNVQIKCRFYAILHELLSSIKRALCFIVL